MYKVGFDNNKYLQMQSERIKERINEFGGKLYLEFGGKLFDDYHASRVLPGFQPDSKLQMLLQLKEQAEIVIVISASDIEKNKIRGDLGITYSTDVLRLINAFEGMGLMVGSVVLTKYVSTPRVNAFEQKLKDRGIPFYHHYLIDGYPANISKIVSDEGYGKNDYIKTTRSLVVITAPGPGSGKMATCLSQLYHENKRGIKAGYAKFETFPIWNIALKHPVNIAYEAATADLNDVNMIDPWHLEAYGETTVNYNRDVEIFPVLKATFDKIYGKCPYKSPTDMGVNMAGNCIFDDEAVKEAANQEILRRFFNAKCNQIKGRASKDEIYKLELLMNNAGLCVDDRKCALEATKLEEKTGAPAAAIRESVNLRSSRLKTRRICLLVHGAQQRTRYTRKQYDRNGDIYIVKCNLPPRAVPQHCSIRHGGKNAPQNIEQTCRHLSSPGECPAYEHDQRHKEHPHEPPAVIQLDRHDASRHRRHSASVHRSSSIHRVQYQNQS